MPLPGRLGPAGLLGRVGSIGGVTPTNPTVTGAVVAANGTTVTVTFDKVVTGSTGFTLRYATSIPLTYASGSGTNTLIFTATTPILLGDTPFLNYGDGNIADLFGNPLLTLVNGAVTNNSTQPVVTLSVVSVTIMPGGLYVTIVFNHAALGTAGFGLIGPNTSLTYAAGSGTNVYTMFNTPVAGLPDYIYSTDTPTYTYGGTDIHAASGATLAAIPSAPLTNLSTLTRTIYSVAGTFTFTAPSDGYVQLQLIGGGGGGRSDSGVGRNNGGGGAMNRYVIDNSRPVTAGEKLVFVIGAGGAGGDTAGTGGTSTMNGTEMVSPGGKGASPTLSGAPGGSGSGIGNTVISSAGGVGFDDPNGGGGGGGAVGTPDIAATPGMAGTVPNGALGGIGGTPEWGGYGFFVAHGGHGGNGTTNANLNAAISSPGAGGGGAGRSSGVTGGPGKPGAAIIVFFPVPPN